MESDDEIELLKSPPSEESEYNNSSSSYQHQASINPGVVYQSRGPQDDSSYVDPGSFNALQTAFISLQKKHNEQSKKYQELTQRHKLMQKNFGSEQNMDPMLMNNTDAGAGASHNEESTDNTAEHRASQGYIQHLERGLLRSTNNVAKGNAEIERLKQQLSEMESIKQTYIVGRETLQCDIENLTDSLRLAKVESAQKDERFLSLQESLHKLTLHNQALQEENIELKRHVETSDRTSLSLQSKENEIHELQTRIRTTDVENQRLKNNCNELEKRLNDKHLEISALEAKYKQYAIENDINRKHVHAQVQRGSDSIDDVDGETEMIKQAFDLVKHHQDTIQELKCKVDQQKTLINELYLYKTKAIKFHEDDSVTTPYPTKNIDVREAAQGASFHPYMDEKPRSPIYANHSPRGYPTQPNSPRLPPSVKQVSPVPSIPTPSNDADSSRGGSGDSRINDIGKPIMVSPRTNELGKPLTVSPRTDDLGKPLMVSPRINDSVKPTGNVNVPRMIASQQSPPLVCYEDRNAMDALRPAASSPRAQIGSVRTEAHGYNRRNIGDYNTSPVNIRKSSPSYVNDQEQTGILNIQNPLDYGARPRTSPSNNIRSNLPLNAAQITTSRIPDRMTQSEIIVRDRSPGNHDNNFQQPMTPLDLLGSSSRSLENIYKQGQGQIYDPNTGLHQRSSSQPDYENVYENRNDREGPNNDYDHSIYVNNADIMMPQSNRVPVEHASQQVEQEESVNSVSALKICPSCSNEFSRLTMDQFQRHVFECFDNFEEPPTTLQPEGADLEEDRTCPMCGATFPLTIPQETYEQHVLAHFGEEPLVDGYEMLNN